MSEFKINELPQKYEDIIIPLFNMNDKFVLGGSLALYMLNIMDYNFNSRSPDIDLSILESLTEEELVTVRDFFNLEFDIKSGDYDTIADENGNILSTNIKPPSYFLNKELIQLSKGEVNVDGMRNLITKIDIFNNHILRAKDSVHIKYKGEYTLRLTHPSIILAYKSQYAYDNRVNKQYKHFEDIQKIDWKKYFPIVNHMEYVWDEDYKKITNSIFPKPQVEIQNV
jgi:hypothetical protein